MSSFKAFIKSSRGCETVERTAEAVIGVTTNATKGREIDRSLNKRSHGCETVDLIANPATTLRWCLHRRYKFLPIL